MGFSVCVCVCVCLMFCFVLFSCLVYHRRESVDVVATLFS